MTRTKGLDATVAKVRTDGRKPLLVYLNKEVIKQLKKTALDQDRTAYEITEEAVRQWLAAYKGRKSE